MDDDLLFLILHILENGHRQVGLHGQSVGLAALVHVGHYRGIVPGIAIAEAARGQVEHTDKQRDEHVGVVRVGHRVIDGGDNPSRVALLGSHDAHQTSGDSHHQRGRHPLT